MSQTDKKSRSDSETTVSTNSDKMEIDEIDEIDKAIADAYEPSVELHYTKESEKDDVNLLKEPTLLTMGDNVVETKDGRLIDVKISYLLKIGRNMKNLLRKEEKKKSRKKSKKNKKKSKKKKNQR